MGAMLTRSMSILRHGGYGQACCLPELRANFPDTRSSKIQLRAKAKETGGNFKEMGNENDE